MNKYQLEAIAKMSEKDKSRNIASTRKAKRESLKFRPMFRLRDKNKLKIMFPFKLFDEENEAGRKIINKYTNNLNDFKGLLFLFTLIYNTNAFSNSFFSAKNDRKIILLKKSDFYSLFGYNTKPFFFLEEQENYLAISLIYENLTEEQKKHQILNHLFEILHLYNKQEQEQKKQKTFQYKCFNFLIIMSFLNRFKKNSIPFLLYILSLYRYCNKPIVKHNLSNVLRLSEIPLRPSKQRGIDRINSYFQFLKDNKIILNEELKTYTIEDLTNTSSLNIHLNLVR